MECQINIVMYIYTILNNAIIVRTSSPHCRIRYFKMTFQTLLKTLDCFICSMICDQFYL